MVDKEEGEVSTEEGELPEEGQEAKPAPAPAAAAPAAPAALPPPPQQAAQAPPAAAPQQPDPQQQQPPGGLSRPGSSRSAAAPPPLQQPQHQHQQRGGPLPSVPPGPDSRGSRGSRERGGGGGGSRPPSSTGGGDMMFPRPPPPFHHHPQHDGGPFGGGPGGPGPGSSSRQQQQQRLQSSERESRESREKAEREKAELSQELDRLTAGLTFQEIRTNWGTACPNIKAAIKKLDKLLRRVKRKRDDDVELYPPCLEFASRILAALKHVTVITSTGLGKTVDMDLGHNIMKTAVNYRHEIFSASQKRDLEAAIRESKEFAYLFTDRDKQGRPIAKAPTAAAAAAAATGTQPGQQQGQDHQQQRVPLARGDSAKGQRTSPQKQQQQRASPSKQQQQQGSRSHSPPSPPAAPVPPPPEPPAPPEEAAEAEAAAEAAQQQQQQQQQQQPVGGKPAPAAAIPATRQGSMIKIVVNSTAVGAAAAAAGAGAAAGRAPSPAAAGDDGSREQQQQRGGGSSAGLSGSKRGQIEIRDLMDDADDDADGDVNMTAAAAGMLRDGDGSHRQQHQQAAKRARHADSDGQQREQQQVPLPWESEEHRRAVEQGTPLQAVMCRLLESRRLVLVLDLDHTLVNSVKFSEVDREWEYKLEQQVAQQLSRPREAQDLHRLVRMGMWTKLRPGVRDFLRRAAPHFELWIYTAGSRPYADAMAELLDPDGRYFGSRVIAQGAPEVQQAAAADDGTAAAAAQQQPLVFKRLLQGLEGCEPVVLIVDDSSAVWPHDRRNLFIVERYIYFPSSRRRLGMAGKSLMEVERDECPQRGMLMTALRVFEALHAAVFERLPQAPLSPAPEAAGVWDVRNVMAAEKRRVLQGVVLVFSRVIPLETNPRQHPLWLLAEQYGATCSEQCSEDTTHVVAMTGGTEKVMWARQNNKFVVGPAWLECSCILWQHASEDRFPPPQ